MTFPLGFGLYSANRVKKERKVKREEKFGILLMIVASLSGLVAIAIADGWVPRFDVVQNLMLTLRFRLLAETDSIYSPATIDFPTKYVILVLIFVVAYGFTTYLSITPAWKTGKESAVSKDLKSDI